jgi:hypothetical protein
MKVDLVFMKMGKYTLITIHLLSGNNKKNFYLLKNKNEKHKKIFVLIDKRNFDILVCKFYKRNRIQ